MLQRLWLWSPSLQISMAFIAAASPAWRNTLPTTHRFCVSPRRATGREAHPSSCAPWKTVSSQHWQWISVLGFWLDRKARIFKTGCLKLDLRFTISLQSLVKLLYVSDLNLCVFFGPVTNERRLVLFSLWSKPGWIYLHWSEAESFIVWFS